MSKLRWFIPQLLFMALMVLFFAISYYGWAKRGGGWEIVLVVFYGLMFLLTFTFLFDKWGTEDQ